MKNKPDYIFTCSKCEHRVYVGKDRIQKMLKTDCPECGEECYELWILSGEGNFDKQYGS